MSKRFPRKKTKTQKFQIRFTEEDAKKLEEVATKENLSLTECYEKSLKLFMDSSEKERKELIATAKVRKEDNPIPKQFLVTEDFYNTIDKFVKETGYKKNNMGVAGFRMFLKQLEQIERGEKQ